MSRVLRHIDGLNLSNSCVSVAFLFLITRLSADQSTFVGYPSEDCRRYSIDKEEPNGKEAVLGKEGERRQAGRRWHMHAKGWGGDVESAW